MIVKLGPEAGTGKLARTVREKEEGGRCAHCNTMRKVLFSYSDDNIHVCRRECWVAYRIMMAGVRTPTKSQVREHNEKMRKRASDKLTGGSHTSKLSKQARVSTSIGRTALGSNVVELKVVNA